jgi:hypothetical protein
MNDRTPSGNAPVYAAPISVREKGRRQVVALVTLIYLLLIFEGALRKWLLTSYGQLLFFIRDPVVLAVYWMALRYSFFPRGRAMLTAGLMFGALGLLLIVLQAVGVASGIEKWPMLAVYGWRNYFLYIPLPFVIGEVFDQVDVRRIVRLTLLLAIPIAPLVLMQFRSSPDAPVNVGFAASVEQQYHGLTVDETHTRPMGTFTSDVGQKEFIVSCVAMLLALWISPASRRFVKSWQLMAATAAVLTCLALSGSRGAMIASGIVAAAAVASAAVVRSSGTSTRAFLIPTMIAVAAVVLYPIVFPEGYSTYINRWNLAEAAETQFFGLGVYGRALYGFIDFFNLIGGAPIAGYGLGLAGNASLTLGVIIPGFTGWAETDWARHIVDLGPVLGIAFIIYRIALVSWLGMICLAGTRRSGDTLPLLLFADIGVDLLYGELTGHGTVNGYGWLFAGLCIAASKAPTPGKALINVSDEPVLGAPRFANLMR